MSSRQDDLLLMLSNMALENSLSAFNQTRNEAAKRPGISPPQLHPVVEKQPLSVRTRSVCSPRPPRSSRRIVSTRSSISLFSERPKGGVIPPDKFEFRQKSPSPPPRSVQRMVEPLPLILTDKQSVTGGTGRHMDKGLTSSTFGECNRNSTQSTDSFTTAHTLDPSTPEQKPHQGLASGMFLTAPSPPPFMDFGMFLSRDSALHVGSSRREYADCPCSPPGSPCEAICIFEDYAAIEESPPDTQVADLSELPTRIEPSRGSSNSSAVEVDAFGVNLEGATLFNENYLESPKKNNSWLDDAVSEGEAECEMSPAKWRARRESLKVLSWVTDSSGTTSQDLDDSLEFATALAPSRPRLVQIPSRSNSTCSSDYAKSSPSYANSTIWSKDSAEVFQQGVSIKQLLSPPTTPIHEKHDNDKTLTSVSSKTIHQSPHSAFASGFETPPKTPGRMPRPLFLTSEGVPELIAMLESSVKTFPSTMLQFDSPSILQLYHVQSQPYVPPLPHPGVVRFQHSQPSSSSVSLVSAPISSLSSSSTLHQHYNDIDELATRLAIFRHIFPSTSESADFLRTALYAHILVLNFLTDLIPSSLDNSIVHFQPQAFSTPGVIEPVEGQSQLYDRVVKVSAAIRDCIGRLLDSCCGKGGGDETLLKALKQVVRLVESTTHGKEMF